jgi:hypothetical protein
MNRLDYLDRLNEIKQLVDEADVGMGETPGWGDFQLLDQIADRARSLADSLEFDLSFE